MVNIGFSPVDMVKGTVGNVAAVGFKAVGAEGMAQNVSTGKVRDALIATDDNPQGGLQAKAEAALRLSGNDELASTLSSSAGGAKDLLDKSRNGELSVSDLKDVVPEGVLPEELTSALGELEPSALTGKLPGLGGQGLEGAEAPEGLHSTLNLAIDKLQPGVASPGGPTPVGPEGSAETPAALKALGVLREAFPDQADVLGDQAGDAFGKLSEFVTPEIAKGLSGILGGAASQGSEPQGPEL